MPSTRSGMPTASLLQCFPAEHAGIERGGQDERAAVDAEQGPEEFFLPAARSRRWPELKIPLQQGCNQRGP